ncbi:NUDIX domain-containing protein [Microbacterium sp. NPDC057650]|uniref:NUDIX domain-containing protein n=1 Tax=unclassified Microbacterium TaxID=2609290 RepID=UPI00366FD2CF
MTSRTAIAAAALVRDGRMLLVRRHPRREAHPDRWALPGGHVEPGERPDEAVVRECLEELGVRIRDPRPIPMTVDHPGLDMFAFLATAWDGEPANTEPDEHDDLRWFQPDELAGLRLAHPESLADLVAAVETAEG